MSTHATNEVNTNEFTARAVRVGDYIGLRSVPTKDRLGSGPLAVRIGDHGVAVLLRYGVVVFFDCDHDSAEQFLVEIRPLVRKPAEQEESEVLHIRVDSGTREGIDGEALNVHNGSVERLQVIADVLGKSVALAGYESQTQEAFDRIEPFASDLARTGHGGGKVGKLQKHLGNVLLIQHEMIGRVEVDDKPDILWERPDLERLHAILTEEFEIHERKIALERKLSLVSQTTETVVGLIENARTLRVEWYIVILIVIEILLLLYEMAQ